MSDSSKLLRVGEGGRLTFKCPGCKRPHSIQTGEGAGPRWGWNASVYSPTFTPSVLVTWTEPSDVPEEFDDATKDRKMVCHSFVTSGMIQFLNDCTHELAGRTVALAKWEE